MFLWLVLTKSLPYALAPNSPDTALALNPNNPVALLVKAEEHRAKLVALTNFGVEKPKRTEDGVREERSNTLSRLPEAKESVDLPRFRGEAWCWVSVADWRSWRRPPCGCSFLVRPQRSPFLHPGPCAGSAVARSPCQARAFCAPARACA